MSVFRNYGTVMNDKKCLVAALKKRFPEVESHSAPQNLNGYQGDVRQQKAHVIVRREHVGQASNDLGFVRDGANFKAIISGYDSGKYNQKWLDHLTVDYMEIKATKTVSEYEAELEERVVLPNGSIQLLYRVPAHA
jgi:hypothetical protein